MSFYPFSSVTVQYRCSSCLFFLLADIITQGIKAKHQYIMSTHHLIHIQIRILGLFASRQFIYFQCQEAVQSLDLQYAGVDVLIERGTDIPYIIEVNGIISFSVLKRLIRLVL